MSAIPGDLRYTKDHEWVRQEAEVYVVGITAHAADQLGDVTFAEVPMVGKNARKGEAIATVESVKAASDVYAPLSGTVCAANETLVNAPEQINQDPYGTGWFFKLENVNAAEYDSLMDAKAYQAHVEASS
ncbi:MAG: glycine cleavage system H protein [Candidatus Hydrogenedentota bacterium]